MASLMSQSNPRKSSLFSLTGYLELLQKNLFKNTLKRYWFWFDEQTCSLKYYRNHESYALGIHEPLGSINLLYAKVTPGIASSSSSTHVFHINVNSQVYKLTACSTNEALTWVENLQGKRGEFIKVRSAMEDTMLEQEKERYNLRPPSSKPMGALVPTSPVDSPLRSSPGVESIVLSKIRDGIDEDPECAVSLSPRIRTRVELEAELLDQQVVVSILQKEVLQLKEKVVTRDDVIMALNFELVKVHEQMTEMDKPYPDLMLEIDSLKDIIEQYKRSLRSLDDEIELHKLNQNEHNRRIDMEKQKVLEMERDLNMFKSKYVKLLSTCFKIHTHNLSRGSEEEDPDLIKNTNELLSLTEQEGGDKQNYRGSFEDLLGDIHDWQNDVVTHHYLCRQLYLHYNQNELETITREWDDFISQVKRTRKPYLDFLGGDRSKKKELRLLLHKGVPIQHRRIVWTGLVFGLVGKVKLLRDSTADGGSYYWSLVNSNCKSAMEKQIKIDLHRTLPNNRHFKSNGSGIPKLSNVLLAFSLHDKNIGYCQGMNMVAALGLLFLDEETVFWFMIAIIEKLLPHDYYTPTLIGVRADQMVMKDLLTEKLPRLNLHMERHGIDITFVTLNWFITIFADTMPTESALRIMDCFLLEGIKFLFKASLGVLSLNQNAILKQHDQFILFQLVKAISKHCFDVEALHQEILNFDPFPNTSNLQSRHLVQLTKLNEQALKTDRLGQRKNARSGQEVKVERVGNTLITKDTPAVVPLSSQQRVVWECGCVCGEDGEEVWLCGGEGQLGIISRVGEGVIFNLHTAELSSRVICIQYLPILELVLIGTLDFHLLAIDYSTKTVRWSYSMNDSLLAITVSLKGVVFAALADGFVAIIQDIYPDKSPQPLLLRIGSTAVSTMLLVGAEQQHLWCGCGKAIIIICTEKLEPVESLVMADGLGRVNKILCDEGVGVWACFRSSSSLLLYHASLYIPLLTLDYFSLLPPHLQSPDTDEVTHKSNFRITSIMLLQGRLWVGTGAGCVLIFSYNHDAVADLKEATRALFSQRRTSNEGGVASMNSLEGGLLSSTVVVARNKEDEMTGTPEEEWVKVEGKKVLKEDKPSNNQKLRRKTQFGRTLRNKSYKRSRGTPDIYTLILEACNDKLAASNEPVRVLLPIRCSNGVFGISSINTVKTDWQKGVQLWTCSEDTPPTEWSYQYLSLSGAEEKASANLPSNLLPPTTITTSPPSSPLPPPTPLLPLPS